ncbi:methyltransferase domain-containing protein [Hahella sp. KA22]|uniref:class I SAM-dependent methyltransferase n=1 Tax=Hahella sp. KA22 TaxID=1628392 RepID=UPI000FDE1E7C|nr:class I SAM-dependent methyltransferase [Hahella sp. KA22]AZZ92381.1 class I SAM-dependent methyltransferase [Hahella sp. KA22]QAY55755.1 methyltransferase domain-containing protein [Hahella sp. KA22]
MDFSIKFWDNAAERYARRPVTDVSAYEKKLAVTQQFFSADMRVLEFGCGTGSTALVHAPRVAEYLATDASSKMIDIARAKLRDQSVPGLRFDVATLDDYSGQSESYDAILGLNILHLLRDPDQAIQQVYRLLKPGGVFISNTACLSDTRPYLRLITPVGRLLRLMPYVKFLSRKGLEASMERAGFEFDYKWMPETTKDVYFLVARKRR